MTRLSAVPFGVVVDVQGTLIGNGRTCADGAWNIEVLDLVIHQHSVHGARVVVWSGLEVPRDVVDGLADYGVDVTTWGKDDPLGLLRWCDGVETLFIDDDADIGELLGRRPSCRWVHPREL